jgi:hypothetical protein
LFWPITKQDPDKHVNSNPEITEIPCNITVNKLIMGICGSSKASDIKTPAHVDSTDEYPSLQRQTEKIIGDFNQKYMEFSKRKKWIQTKEEYYTNKAITYIQDEMTDEAHVAIAQYDLLATCRNQHDG